MASRPNKNKIESLLMICARFLSPSIKKEDLPKIPKEVYEPLQKYMEKEKQIKLFSTYKAWWPDGGLWKDYSYTKGKKNGICRRWWNKKKGIMVSEINYQNGIRNGLARWWWEPGFLQCECTYVDGKKEGASQEWGAWGHLTKQTFVHGHLNGPYREYYWHGTSTGYTPCIKAHTKNGGFEGLYQE